MVCGDTPPTARSRVAFGQHRAQRPHRGGGRHLGREQLEAVGARRQGGEGLRGREEAGKGNEAECLGAADDAGVGVGRDDDRSACRGDPVDVRFGQHRPGADQGPMRRARVPGGRCSRRARAS